MLNDGQGHFQIFSRLRDDIDMAGMLVVKLVSYWPKEVQFICSQFQLILLL